jgi:uncharacterized protein YggE
MKRIPALIFILCAWSVVAFAQNSSEPPLITVTGQAEVRVPPDEVVFTLGVESVDKDILVAQKRTDDRVREVLGIARKNNVKPEDVQTSYISIQPKYNTDDLDYEARRRVNRELLGYQVSKTIAVILRDITRFDSLLSDVLKAGVTSLSNLQFRDSKIREHRDQARSMAIKAAQQKAQLLAGQIGQSIGPAYSITESSLTPYSNVTQNVAGAGGRSDEGSEGAIAPGSISIAAQITVRFKLNP